MLQDSINFRDFDSEAILIAKVVKIIRRDIFERESFYFSGSFPCNCQENFVSPMFMSMLLNGIMCKIKVQPSRKIVSVCTFQS